MVTHINFAVDDDLAERAKRVKGDRDLSWPEFLEVAVHELGDGDE